MSGPLLCRVRSDLGFPPIMTCTGQHVIEADLELGDHRLTLQLDASGQYRRGWGPSTTARTPSWSRRETLVV
jgi:hypothetical protein